MIEVGTILQNRYRIEKQIGQGGMGKVYVATDERFKSTVAIKETVFEDKNLRRAFEGEARLLNSLRHPALPRVSDHFNEDDGQFLVMEYIAGEDLAETMERNGAAFPIEKVLNWADQLCDALEYLHSQNIIHRDIKPQNLKLTPNGQIVLLDFGLAKGNPTDAQHQTAAKSIFGYSRSYASLEQIQGTGTEPRSDLYSLGATVYHLLTGIPPADALTRAMNVLNGHPDPLISADILNKNIPHEVSEIIQKTMALNASERPVSAISLRTMLNESNKDIVAYEADSYEHIPFAADIFNQKTKLFNAETNLQNFSQSNVKTKISPENVSNANSQSKVTNTQPFVEGTKTPKRAKAVGASLLGGLLLAGSTLSAVYFYNSGATVTNSNVGATNSETKSKVLPVLDTIATTNANSENQNADSAAKDSKTQDKAAQAKSVEPAKNSLRSSKNQSEKAQIATKSRKTSVGSNEVVISGDSIETDEMTLNDNGITIKKNPPQPPTPPKYDKGWITPRVRRLDRIKTGRRVIVVEKPSPDPTP